MSIFYNGKKFYTLRTSVFSYFDLHAVVNQLVVDKLLKFNEDVLYLNDVA